MSPARTAVAGLVAVCLVAVLPGAAPAAPSRAPAPEPEAIIVRFEPGTGPSARAAARARAGVRADRRLRSGSQVVRPEPGESLKGALERLRQDVRVHFAEIDDVRTASGLSDDPFLRSGHLWGLHHADGSLPLFGGTLDADVDAPEAWDLARGAGVVVAVADTGVASGHPDLAGRMWSNPGEIPGNRVDDDGNGHVDDIGGWNTAHANADTTDRDGHGTHVAGTIAATGDDGAGVVGVAPAARLMAVKVLGDTGAGSDSSVADGFRYAAENGARVVNASLGGSGTSPEIASAIADHPEVLFVVAAGNGGGDGVGDDNDAPGGEYPCTDRAPNLVCVAATDARDRLAGFSNFGRTSVDLGAPGDRILSAAISQVVLADDFEQQALEDRWSVAGWSRDVDGYGGFARADGAVDATLTSRAFSLTGRAGCELVWASSQTGPYDAYVETSADGTTWSGTAFPAADWPLHRMSLGAGVTRVRFRLAGEAAGDRFHIDDVALTCEGTDAATSFTYASGTSMAAPHVAGVAALLTGHLPSPTAGRVREALLGSGDAVAALEGRTVTGRRANAHAALRYWDGFTAATGAGVAVTASAATLTGTVEAGHVPTEWFFEYGTTTAYGARSPVVTTPGLAAATVEHALTGLAPATTYHYRLVARRGARVVPGPAAQLTTAGPASPPSPVPASPAALPASPAGDDPLAAMRASASVRCRPQRGRRLVCRFAADGADRVRGRVVRRGRVLARFRGAAGVRLAARLRRTRARRAEVRVSFRSVAGRVEVSRRVRLR